MKVLSSMYQVSPLRLSIDQTGKAEMTDHTGMGCACCRNVSAQPDHTHLSRRHLLRASVAGTMAGALGGGLGLALPSAAQAQATIPPINTPDDALQLLMEANQRFVDRKLTFQ